VVASGTGEVADGGTVRRVFDGGIAAYNAHDFDTFRTFFGPDFVGVDHRLVSFGTFDTDDFVALSEGLFAQVRTQHLRLQWIEERNNVGLARTLETGETLHGAEFSFEALFVSVVVEEQLQRWDIFDPEAEADARSLFEERATSSAEEDRQ
jgi:hypothetical protein